MGAMASCEQSAKDFRLIRALDQVEVISDFSIKFLILTRLNKNMMQYIQ